MAPWHRQDSHHSRLGQLAARLYDPSYNVRTSELFGSLFPARPAMIVIEDVDSIARKQEEMYGPCDESLLNKLLNEMDGLREDAAVLFLLTTNRPEHLDAALASRPGRIDQAIEFPLPDDHGRRQLIRLYACGLALKGEVVELVVKKTKNASPAFIKELMRRCAQYCVQNGGGGALESQALDSALEEMLLTGGSLNAKLLGASGVEISRSVT
jgi:ATP-dependent 26S proteasome regulatory subunit